MDTKIIPEFNHTHQWKHVACYPGYIVTSNGEVWSCRTRGPGGRFGKWRRLQMKLNREGYARASLCRGGKVKTVFVHTLVLEAFVGSCPSGLQCRHLDGNRINNATENLAWGTSKENMADKIRHGTTGAGERNINAKLTSEQVILARELRLRHPRRKSGVAHFLARWFGVSAGSIRDAYCGHTWKQTNAEASRR